MIIENRGFIDLHYIPLSQAATRPFCLVDLAAARIPRGREWSALFSGCKPTTGGSNWPEIRGRSAVRPFVGKTSEILGERHSFCVFPWATLSARKFASGEIPSWTGDGGRGNVRRGLKWNRTHVAACRAAPRVPGRFNHAEITRRSRNTFTASSLSAKLTGRHIG